ncbi:LOW QUALITY PROTEIN: hypothetical protein QYF61_007079 [Mycteria americana]|uniref:Uncharacterized protein n=1 Tax=Mycteria americana TaxID=33587 RepID=A0AAN7N0R2_MYCAM|nr:LOW QUALITY PROTEIN: hypothetical protein QYF61_007079 [Mycteria americana]
MLDNPFGEDIFPNTQSNPPLAQLEAISSHPITFYLGKETDTHLATASFQVAVESDKVSPQPPFLQTNQPQFPQPLLIRLTLHQLHCSSLDVFQHLSVFLVVRGPKLNTAFEVQPQQFRVQGDNHFPSPAGHRILIQARRLFAFLATWARCQLIFSHLLTNTPRCKASGFAFLNFMRFVSPFLQPAKVPLDDSMTLWHISHSSQFFVIANLLRWTAQGPLSSPARQRAARQDLPLSRDASQGYSSRLRDSLPQQILEAAHQERENRNKKEQDLEKEIEGRKATELLLSLKIEQLQKQLQEEKEKRQKLGEKVEMMLIQALRPPPPPPPPPDIVQIRKLIVSPEDWDGDIWGDPDDSQPEDDDPLFPTNPPEYEARPIVKTEQTVGPRGGHPRHTM